MFNASRVSRSLFLSMTNLFPCCWRLLIVWLQLMLPDSFLCPACPQPSSFPLPLPHSDSSMWPFHQTSSPAICMPHTTSPLRSLPLVLALPIFTHGTKEIHAPTLNLPHISCVSVTCVSHHVIESLWNRSLILFHLPAPSVLCRCEDNTVQICWILECSLSSTFGQDVAQICVIMVLKYWHIYFWSSLLILLEQYFQYKYDVSHVYNWNISSSHILKSKNARKPVTLI